MFKPLINPTPHTGWKLDERCFYYDPSLNKLARAKILGVSTKDVTLRLPGLAKTVEDVPFDKLFTAEDTAMARLRTRAAAGQS